MGGGGHWKGRTSPLITRNPTKPVINLRPSGSLPLLRSRRGRSFPGNSTRSGRRERLSRRSLSTWNPINPVIITVALLLLVLKVCVFARSFFAKGKPILG